VGKLLEDSCRSKYVKIRSSKCKFEQCSGVCVGKQKFCFFQVKRYEHIVGVGARKARGEQSDFVEFAWNLVEASKDD